MKFTISKLAFLDGLKKVASVVSTKATLPILSNVKIEAANDQLRFMATDLDVCITGSVPANILRPGEITLPAKKLVSIISELPDAEVQVEVNDNHQASVHCGRSHFKLNGLPADEFPTCPSFDDAIVYQVEQNTLRDCIRRTEYAISTDTTRYVLNGISMAFRQGKVTLVATDGRRLALAESVLDTPAEQELDAILPTKAVAELRRLLEEVGSVTIRFTRNQVAFEIKETLLISKLIDGNYPNYRQVIPNDCRESTELPCGELLETVRRVSLLSDKSTTITLNFRENELELVSSAEIGEARESMAINYTGTPLSISFNPDFFMAPLKTMSADTIITLNLIDEMSPGVLKIGEEFLYVLMPMRNPN